jgi:bacteriorhodopsin
MDYQDAAGAAWIFFGVMGVYALMVWMTRHRPVRPMRWLIKTAIVMTALCGLAVFGLSALFGWTYTHGLTAGFIGSLFYVQVTRPPAYKQGTGNDRADS